MRSALPLAIAILLATTQTFAPPVKGGGFEVRVVSARADMVSGGDVLIEIAAPPSAATRVAMTVNGHEPHAEIRPTPTTRLVVRLRDLQLGPNVIDIGVQGQRPAVGDGSLRVGSRGDRERRMLTLCACEYSSSPW
jgi:hypothetical protein